jgi:hypothetical protein
MHKPLFWGWKGDSMEVYAKYISKVTHDPQELIRELQLKVVRFGEGRLDPVKYNHFVASHPNGAQIGRQPLVLCGGRASIRKELKKTPTFQFEPSNGNRIYAAIVRTGTQESMAKLLAIGALTPIVYPVKARRIMGVKRSLKDVAQIERLVGRMSKTFTFVQLYSGRLQSQNDMIMSTGTVAAYILQERLEKAFIRQPGGWQFGY